MQVKSQNRSKLQPQRTMDGPPVGGGGWSTRGGRGMVHRWGAGDGPPVGGEGLRPLQKSSGVWRRKQKIQGRYKNHVD